jgi:riboflavin kinase/FMN adenylyltransferase
MQVIRGLYNLKDHHRNTVLTIGNFDGVHRGHQTVLAAVVKQARAQGLSATVMIFEPQPLEFFAPSKAPARLTRLSEKLQALKDNGIDQVLLIRFNAAFAALTAEEFIHKILVDGLAVKHLYVGDDFCFGKNRGGNFDTLVQSGLVHGFEVENLHTIADEEGRFSSTRIRQHLSEGDFAGAEVCLGRAYRMCGRVAHGHKQGRSIGYPTINIELKRNKSPLMGVYAVRVYGLTEDGSALNGAASIGNRPVVEDDDHYLLEVYIFDFEREIYGEHVQVEFVSFIRPEMDFESFQALKSRIDEDARKVLEVLSP